jgi:hypothetical protein
MECPPGAVCEPVELPARPSAPSGAADEAATEDEGEAASAEGSAEDDEAMADESRPRRRGRRVRAITRGPDGSETVILLRGNERLLIVDDDGNETEVPSELADDGDEEGDEEADEDGFESNVPPPPGKAKKRRWRETFGASLRLQGAGYQSPFGDQRADLGGLGASFRWRPVPHFALDGGLDLFRGVGFTEENRAEVEGAVSALLYFNPQHRVQIYGLGGFHAAHAELGAPVDDEWRDAAWSESSGRDYFGIHGGLGLEFRATRLLGLALDLVGVVRTKVDESSAEFVDLETGTTSNVSGGGRLRAAVNFWW